MRSHTEEIFIDNSILLDLCRSYADEYGLTEQIVDNLAVTRTISKKGGKEFSDQTSNRQQLYEYLINETSKYRRNHLRSDEVDSLEYPEEELISGICEHILDPEVIDDRLPFGLNDEYDYKIEDLRTLLQDLGVDEFLEEINEIQYTAMTQEEKIERKILIDRRFDGREDTMAEAYLSDTISSPIQRKVLVDAARWEMENNGKHVLVSSSNDAYGEGDSINSTFSFSFIGFSKLEFESPDDLEKAMVKTATQ